MSLSKMKIYHMKNKKVCEKSTKGTCKKYCGDDCRVYGVKISKLTNNCDE